MASMTRRQSINRAALATITRYPLDRLTMTAPRQVRLGCGRMGVLGRAEVDLSGLARYDYGVCQDTDVENSMRHTNSVSPTTIVAAAVPVLHSSWQTVWHHGAAALCLESI